MLELLLTHGSYLLIVAILVLTAWGLPVPEEIPVAAAGILSAYGRLNAWGALGCCLLGAVAGDCVMYWIGYHFGPGMLWNRRWFARLLSPQRQAKAERMFRRHGFKVLLPFRRFLLIDLISAGTVVCMFFALTYFWGQSLLTWIGRAEVLLSAVVVAAAGAGGVWLWRRRRMKRRKLREPSAPGSMPPAQLPVPPAAAEKARQPIAAPGPCAAEPCAQQTSMGTVHG